MLPKRWAKARPPWACSRRTPTRCCPCRRRRAHLGWREDVRLSRDYYVRVDTNDYSVGSWWPSTRAGGPGA
ncbi:Mu transposase domain-containing protein [Ornithinimicrobium kibberense]|uniref:Transposase for insertion sequence element IS21-like C-terminal domain-containing protein n=2 Tax=Ornithinimicrobium kibberense TaxID=282060 RepID=A0ABV5V5Y7_9MICO